MNSYEIRLNAPNSEITIFALILSPYSRTPPIRVTKTLRLIIPMTIPPHSYNA